MFSGCLIGFTTTDLMGSGLKKFIESWTFILSSATAPDTFPEQHLLVTKTQASCKRNRNAWTLPRWGRGVARGFLSKWEKEHPQKLLQNHRAAYEHIPSGIQWGVKPLRLRLKSPVSSPEPLEGALQRSFRLGWEGESLALARTGGRTSRVEMGMREIQARHRLYSGL